MIPPRPGLVLAALAIAAWPIAPSAEAATFTVTTPVDDNGPCLPDDCSLREAVLAAHETSEADVVEVPAGVHLLSLQPKRAGDSGAPGSGPIYILGIDVEIRGLSSADEVIVDANEIDSAFFIGTGSNVGLFDLTIRNARGFIGGGVHSWLSSLRIERCSFENNVADGGFGGGLRVTGGQAHVRDSSFVGNSAVHGGGGLFLMGLDASNFLEIVNTTISGNSALGGGAIGARNEGRLEIVHTTIVGNSASPGGSGDGLSTNLATVFISNSLFADDCSYYQAPFPASNGSNLESPGETCFDPADGDLMGVPDPHLLPLGDNGGPTPSHALLSSSPAVDAAGNRECESADQRGVPRPQRAGCDIGAFELEDPSVVEIPTVSRIGAVGLAILLGGLAAARLVAPRRVQNSGRKRWISMT